MPFMSQVEYAWRQTKAFWNATRRAREIIACIVVGVAQLSAKFALWTLRALWSLLARCVSSPLCTRRPSYFSPSHIETCVLILLAISIGTMVYASLVRYTYVTLFSQYRRATVADELLAADPTVPPAPDRALTRDEDISRLFRALQLMKLPADLDTLAEVDKSDAGEIVAAMYPDPKAKNPPVTFSRTPTAEVFVHVAAHLPGGNETSNLKSDERRTKLADLVAALLANQPGASATFRDAMRELDAHGSSPVPAQLVAQLGESIPLKKGLTFSSDHLFHWKWNGAPLYFRGWKLMRRSNPIEVYNTESLPLSNSELISAFYRINGVTSVDASHRPLPKAQKNANDEDAQRRKRYVTTAFLGGLLEHLRADHAVKKASKNIPLWQGYEQCAMMIIFSWTVLLMIWREIRIMLVSTHARRVVRTVDSHLRNHLTWDSHCRALPALEGKFTVPLDDKWHTQRASAFAPRLALVCINYCYDANGHVGPDVDGFRRYCRMLRERENASRWFMKWLAFALPAIGFIGTKRGIAGALSQADIIVRAQDPGAQAVAISTVTGTLGIAFTTTLIALIMGLVTTLLNLAQSHREAALMNDLEGAMLPLLDPAIAPGAASNRAIGHPVQERSAQRVAVVDGSETEATRGRRGRS